jgi:hypothetical protein
VNPNMPYSIWILHTPFPNPRDIKEHSFLVNCSDKVSFMLNEWPKKEIFLDNIKWFISKDLKAYIKKIFHPSLITNNNSDHMLQHCY